MTDQPVILSVGGDLTMQAHVAGMLIGAGFAVCTAADPGEALLLAGNLQPALVLLHTASPDSASLAFCQALKAGSAALHPLCLLLHEEPGHAAVAGDDGVDAWLAWPCSDRELLALVRLLLRLYASEQQCASLSHIRDERVKELECFYTIARILSSDADLTVMLQHVCEALPPSWHYPEITCARIIFDERSYVTSSFSESAWRQASDLVIAGTCCGRIEVFYSEARPELDEGPFLKEERRLLDSIAHLLGAAIERWSEAQALRRSEERFRTYFNESLVGMAFTSLEKGWIEVNPQLCRFFGYPQEELVTLTWAELTHPDDLAADLYEFERLVRGESDGYTMEKRFIRKDGAIIHGSIAARAVRRQDGTIDYFVAQVLDITAREETELEYRSIFQAAIDGFWIINAADGHLLEVNDTYCRMVGYSQDELLAMRIPDLEAIQNPEEIAARMVKVAEQGYDRFEACHRCKDGRLLYLDVSTQYAESRGGLFVVFLRDISERKATEQALRRSEARYRTLLTALPDRVFRHNSAGIFVDFHAPRDAAMIMPPEAFMGKHYREVVPPAISEPFDAAVARARSSGEMASFEYDLPAPDGKQHSFETRVVVGEDQDTISIVRDITDRRRAERALREQHEQFLAIFDAFPEILYVVDPATDEILFVNRVFQELLGGAPIGGKCYYEFQGFDRRCDFCTNELILRTRQPYTWEYHNPHLNRDLLITDQIIRWPDGRDVRFELAIDISARKRAEQERERLTRELARKNRELEQLIYVASHDLRSPLVNVQGFSRELQLSLGDLKALLARFELPAELCAGLTSLLEEDFPESLNYILTSVTRMDSLLKGLLQISRLGRAALHIIPLDVNQLVIETVMAFDFMIKQAGAHVEVEPLPGCKGDPVRVGQLFANLLSNALKYLDPARPGRIVISGEVHDGQVLYYVTDNGIGIATEHQSRIFELYHRLNPSQSEGDGMGLSIVRTILDRHGGSIRVESEPGVGSRFIVTLPEAP